MACRLVAFPGWLVHSTQPNMAGAGAEAGEAGDGGGKAGGTGAGTGGKAAADGMPAADEGGRAFERISVSFNFRQRRKDVDPASAPANEVVRADLPAR